ncbi:MAG: TetR/AcrR family transcriptional regulator [Actinomycetota bacterium]|nr:TetR/AcrR family transcriptional regulator [Actinomycetota bacterium]
MSEPRGPAGRKRSTGAHRAIIEATLAMLREAGYHQFTVEGVAARAGVGKATVYRWWPSKASLVVEALSGQLGEPIQPTGDTEHDVRAMIASTFDLVGGLLGEVLIADMSRDALAGHQLADLLGPYRAAYGAILLGAAGRGDLPYNVDVSKVVDLIAGMALIGRLMHRPAGPDLIEDLTALVLAGPLPRLPPPRSSAPRS